MLSYFALPWNRSALQKGSTSMHTSHSEYGTLQKLFIKKASDAFHSQDVLDQQWEELNYLSRPRFSEAIKEYDHFESLLSQTCNNIQYFECTESVSIDSIYCRDASITTDFGVILCNMGKEKRKSEPLVCRSKYENTGVKILGEISGNGRVEGGDVAWIDHKTLAVGHGYRTNDEGFSQLKELLHPHGIELIQVDLPHYKGVNDVFHLMSIFSPIDVDKAVVYSPLMPVRFREELIRRNFQLIDVPDEEFESMGCNVLALGPSKCLIVKGNSITEERMKKAGCKVIEYEGNEISIKGGGGPTCLTRPMLREI